MVNFNKKGPSFNGRDYGFFLIITLLSGVILIFFLNGKQFFGRRLKKHSQNL